MAPIEVVFAILVFVFALIGLGRGFLKELGTTTVMMILLFFMSRFDVYLDRGLVKGITTVDATVTSDQVALVECTVLVFVVMAVAFLSYHGETLAFSGELPRGVQSVVLGLMTGGLNGYLIAGSVWYYMDKFSYPIGLLGFTRENISLVAAQIVDFLPLNFLAQPILLGESLLLYLSAFLVIARVIR